MAERARGDFGPLVDPAGLPEWMGRLVRASAAIDPVRFQRLGVSVPDARSAAVLMLFAGNENSVDNDSGAGSGPDVLLLRRADGLGAHAGQVAFPGGAAEPTDAGPVATALREAAE
ncbi:MAG: NUDIX domain-containing protein, partial [Sciscionella sp.]|nr:NUDIX domain-containing protein [Sciscionella sp.]